MQPKFILRFDGLDADEHRVDMRLLGRALLGTEAAVHDGLWLAIEQKGKRGRKRTDISVQVEAPKAHCLEIQGAIVATAGVLPFAYEVANSLGVDYIKQVISAILLHHGGREADAARHMEQALDIISQQAASTERMHSVTMEAMVRMVEGARRQASDIVAPVGPSADQLKIGGLDMTDTTIIDAAMADAIRSTQRLKVSDMTDVRVQFEALDRKTRKAKVYVNGDADRPIPAEMRDPAFDEFPNAYSEAFSLGAPITVQAKLSTTDGGEIVKLHILDIGTAS